MLRTASWLNGFPGLRLDREGRLAWAQTSASMADRPTKITFGEMRDEMGVRGVLVYCADYRCGHSMAMNADRWPDDVRLSDTEPRFWNRSTVPAMGYPNTT